MACLPAAKRKPNFLAVDFYEEPKDKGGSIAAVSTLNEYYKFADTGPAPEPTPSGSLG